MSSAATYVNLDDGTIRWKYLYLFDLKKTEYSVCVKVLLKTECGTYSTWKFCVAIFLYFTILKSDDIALLQRQGLHAGLHQDYFFLQQK